METSSRASYSLPSVIAVIAAIISLFTGAFFGFMLACVAILFGFIGVALSLSPSVRGGFVSILGVVGGALGIIVAGIKAIAWLF